MSQELIPVHRLEDVPEGMSIEETVEFWNTHQITDELWGVMNLQEQTVLCKGADTKLYAIRLSISDAIYTMHFMDDEIYLGETGLTIDIVPQGKDAATISIRRRQA